MKWLFSGLMLLTLSATAIAVEAQGQMRMPSSSEMTAQVLRDRMRERYREPRGGVDSASAYNALGALAGFGCQMSIREGFIKPGVITADKAFVVAKGKDGKTYFFGDFLNAPLLGGGGAQISVWGMVGGAAQAAGAKSLPDVVDIVRSSAASVGTADFGVPRVPKEFHAREFPMDVLKSQWAEVQTLLSDNHVDPRFWGWTIALAAQYLIVEDKSGFDPAMAARIVMEAAVPMSKVDPASIQ
jgi:hypothetical protein